MLKIKLARFGKRNQAHYRIVVNEARDRRDGKYVALVGHYSPSYQPKVLEIDVKAYDEWIAKGAQATDTVAALYKRFKSGKPFPKKKVRLSKKARAKLEAAKEEKKKPADKPAEEKPTEIEKKPVEVEEKPAKAEEKAVEEQPAEAEKKPAEKTEA
jgi:small subunit ribosomal protein S16